MVLFINTVEISVTKVEFHSYVTIYELLTGTSFPDRFLRFLSFYSVAAKEDKADLMISLKTQF